MEAILLESVRLGWERKMILLAKEAFPGGVAFFLVEKQGGERFPLRAVPGKGRKRVVFLPADLREGDYYLTVRKERREGDESLAGQEGGIAQAGEEEKREEKADGPGENEEKGQESSLQICTLSGSARGKLLLLGQRRFLGEERVIFPMGGDESALQLRCRKKSPYDGRGTWMLERFAYGLSLALRPLGVYRDCWVVFEKFCAQAQDNGAAFFAYCQGAGAGEGEGEGGEELLEERVPKELQTFAAESRQPRVSARELGINPRKVFFILDRRSPAWGRLRGYGRQVVPFMSLRHMLLMSLAPLYVASESRYHGYAWRCPPSPLFREIRRGRHRIFFLQHGVTAMKQVHKVFGKDGYNPMDYFAVTAPWEQEIVVEHFGYERDQVPITGFARWDGWRDLRPLQDRPYILLAPTWRGYLDGRDDQAFLESPYWRAYSSLLQEEELLSLLEELQLVLRFHIHPRLAGHLSCIGAVHPQVEILPYDGVGLPGLLMGASALVTDYSSLAYDGLYLGRPVVLYRFPEGEGEAIEGYVGEEALPGVVVRTPGELCQEVLRLAREGFALPEVKRGVFAHHDQRNCERIARFLKGEGF